MVTESLPPRLLSQLEILQEDLQRRVQGRVAEPGSWLGPLHPVPDPPRESSSCPSCNGQGGNSILPEKSPGLMWQLALTLVCCKCQGRGWLEP